MQKRFVAIHPIHETDNLVVYLTSYLKDTLINRNKDEENNADYTFSPVKEYSAEGIAPLKVDPKQAQKRQSLNTVSSRDEYF